MSVLTDNTAKLRKILEKVENLPEMPPSVAQATPTISVSSGGLITATATQEAGAVAAGTKSATRQLTTKGGSTITPGDAEQTAVSAGTYVTGDIKVAAAAGGKQVVTGTITITNTNKDFAVQLGFKPTILMIDPSASSSSVGDGVHDVHVVGSKVSYYFKSGGSAYQSFNTTLSSFATITLSGGSLFLTFKSSSRSWVNQTYTWYAVE